MNKRFLFLLLLLATTTVAGQDFLTGKVIRVADGDTITILRGKEQVRIRLAEIDAPEKGQAFGEKSRQHLAGLCAGVIAQVVDHGKDRYGRTIGRVYCNGKDVSAEQVKVGLAWVYDHFVSDQSLYELQSAAKVSRLGLWADKNPVPPWEWRRKARFGETKSETTKEKP
jgi:endonuclease YncB( thermonuclease family)